MAAAAEPAQPGPRLRGRRWFDHVRLGFNYRWTDVQAAIGIGQLEKLDRLLALRSEAAARYGALLGGIAASSSLCDDDADHRRSWFVYVVALPAERDRDRVMDELRARRGSATADTSRASTCSRTCASVRLPRGHVPGRRGGRARGRWRCRSTRSSRPRTRSASPRRSAARSSRVRWARSCPHHSTSRTSRPTATNQYAPRPLPSTARGAGRAHPGWGNGFTRAVNT